METRGRTASIAKGWSCDVTGAPASGRSMFFPASAYTHGNAGSAERSFSFGNDLATSLKAKLSVRKYRSEAVREEDRLLGMVPAETKQTSTPTRPTCRRCDGSRLQRSQRWGFLEKYILPRFGLFPWRCLRCETTYYLRLRTSTELGKAAFQ